MKRHLNIKIVNYVLQPAFVIVVLAAGWFGKYWLTLDEDAPMPARSQLRAPLVEIVPLETKVASANLRAFGQWVSTGRRPLVCEVGGRVVSVHAAWFTGGLIPAGEVLVQLETDRPQMALDLAKQALQTAQSQCVQAEAQSQVALSEVTQAEQSIKSAEADLALVQAEADVAVEEYKVLFPDQAVPDLVARKPQLSQAQARLSQATAALARAHAQVALAQAAETTAQVSVEQSRVRVTQAQWDLDRCTLVLSHDLVVVEKHVEVGQYVSPGTLLATLEQRNIAEVQLQLAADDVSWLDTETMHVAEVEVVGPQAAKAKAHIRSIGSDIDPVSRTVAVVLQIDPNSTHAQLRSGAFVHATLPSRVRSDVVCIPASAWRDGGTVLMWVPEESGEESAEDKARQGRLQILAPTMVRREQGRIFVSDLPSEGWLVTSFLHAPVDGMKLRAILRATSTEDSLQGESDV